jgi:hypothetical protein
VRKYIFYGIGRYDRTPRLWSETEVSKRKCHDETRAESDLAGIRLLAEMFGRFEIRDWGLDEPRIRLALISQVFRELKRPVPGERSGHEMVNMTVLWRAANEPADKVPLEWISLSWKPDDQVVEDRGFDGVWADIETAAWYAWALDDRIGIDDVVDMCYI